MNYVKRIVLPAIATSLALTLAPASGEAFCGFYVAGADKDVYNNATMVVMMREGTTTVLSMRNNYQGPPEKFAMVVPVPVVLQKENVKTLPAEVFDRVDKLAAPRLVEYWEQDPCPVEADGEATGWGGGLGTGAGYGTIGAGDPSAYVAPVVEAEFAVGEYDIVILSAKDALGLEKWISDNGYNIPDGAAEHLRPYVAQGSKFFVAKVNPQKVKFKDGMASLSPLRFHYTSKDFNLPIRLGLINAKDKQDLLVHILAKNTRYEVANYNNVTIPTNLIVNGEVRSRFGEFYAALFDATIEKNPNSVVTEYSWNSGTCDPCPGSPLSPNELATLGLDVVGKKSTATGTGSSGGIAATGPPSSVSSRSAKLRIQRLTTSKGLDSAILKRYIRRSIRRFQACYNKALVRNPRLEGKVTTRFTISPEGKTGEIKVVGVGGKVTNACVAGVIQNLRLPKPQGGAVVRALNYFEISSQPSRRRPPRGFSASSNWVLTRLHARYDRTTLGEDLRFGKANAIVGGRGGPSDKLEKGAVEGGGSNQFQGRYIIRNKWQGEIACENPRRGNWGGPPRGVSGTSAPKAATDLAFATRGKMSLASMMTENLPAAVSGGAKDRTKIAVAEPSAPQSEQKKATPTPEDTSKGCSSGGSSSTLPALLILLALLASRRSRMQKFSTCSGKAYTQPTL